MSITGGCSCKNIEIVWHTVDHSLMPRACQCDYCLPKGAAYVSKSGTRVEVTIRSEQLHNEVRHGSENAVFHECTQCDQVVFVTAKFEGEVYGVLNANHLNNKFGFADPVERNFSSQTPEEKRDRWRENWCHPVIVKRLV